MKPNYGERYREIFRRRWTAVSVNQRRFMANEELWSTKVRAIFVQGDGLSHSIYRPGSADERKFVVGEYIRASFFGEQRQRMSVPSYGAANKERQVEHLALDCGP
jgi:hypothetical protein